MLEYVLRAGMKVVFDMDNESRNWVSARPNGTVGVLVDRTRYTDHSARFGNDMNFREPGVYLVDGGWNVLWEGESEPTLTASYNMKPHEDSREEYDQLYREHWVVPVLEKKTIGMTEQKAKLNNLQRISDLPETAFWELDKVRPADGESNFHGDNFENLERVIESINYHHDRVSFVTTWYEKGGEYARMGSVWAHDDNIQLVERGNVWKHYHGEEVSFRSLKEELSFHYGLGKVEEVRNPANGLYSWSKNEVLNAIKNGIADGMKMSGGLFGSSSQPLAIKCKDENLGGRVREATLAGFGWT